MQVRCLSLLCNRHLCQAVNAETCTLTYIRMYMQVYANIQCPIEWTKVLTYVLQQHAVITYVLKYLFCYLSASVELNKLVVVNKKKKTANYSTTNYVNIVAVPAHSCIYIHMYICISMPPYKIKLKA